MTKFYVTINLEVAADNIDEARTLGYDLYKYGASGAEEFSENGIIESCSVEVEEE